MDQLLTTTKTQKNMLPKESNAFNQARDVLGPKRNSHDADKISISSFYKDNKSDIEGDHLSRTERAPFMRKHNSQMTKTS